MSRKSQNKVLNINSITISVFLLHLYLILTLLSNNFEVNTNSIRVVILALIVITFITNIRVKNIMNISRNSLMVLIYVIYLLMYMLVYGKINFENIRMYIFFPYFYLHFSFLLKQTTKDTRKEVVRLNLLALIIYILIFYLSFSNLSLSPGNIVNNIYYIVFLTPFIFYIEKKSIKLSFILLSSYAVLYSQKRAAILIYIIYFIIISFKKIINIKKVKINPILIFSIVLIPIVIIVFKDVFISSYIRMLNIFKDQGSGRLELYDFYIKNISNMNFSEFVFGNKMQRTSDVFGVQSAHTDFLEVFYRIGFLGLILYLLMIFNVFYLNKNDNYNQQMLIIIIFFIMTLFSQLIFVPSYIAYIGLLIPFNNYNHKIRRTHNEQNFKFNKKSI